MIASYNLQCPTCSRCNRLYFDHQLRTPKFGLMHSSTLRKFAYFWGKKEEACQETLAIHV